MVSHRWGGFEATAGGGKDHNLKTLITEREEKRRACPIFWREKGGNRETAHGALKKWGKRGGGREKGGGQQTSLTASEIS